MIPKFRLTGYVDTDKELLRAKKFDNMYVVGDATSVPASKAGSVAHFEVDVIAQNLMSDIGNRQLLPL